MEEQILLSPGTNHSRDYNVLKKCHPKWTQLDGLYQRLDSLQNFATNKKKHTSFDLQQIEAIQNEINFLFKSINSDLLRHINIIICQTLHHFIGKLYEIYKPAFQIVINEKFSVNEYEYVSLIRQVIFSIISLGIYFILGP
jgi:hypothetical protein